LTCLAATLVTLALTTVRDSSLFHPRSRRRHLNPTRPATRDRYAEPPATIIHSTPTHLRCHHPAHAHDPRRQPPTCRHRAAVEEESAATPARIPVVDGDEGEGERAAHRPAQTARRRRSLLAADHEARTAVLRVEEEGTPPLPPPLPPPLQSPAAVPTHAEAARAAEGTTPMCKPPSSFRQLAEAVVVGSSGTLPGPPPCWITTSHCDRTPATAANCAARALY
jgi:hypothetical protein